MTPVAIDGSLNSADCVVSVVEADLSPEHVEELLFLHEVFWDELGFSCGCMTMKVLAL